MSAPKHTPGPWHVWQQPDRTLTNCGSVQIRTPYKLAPTLCEMGGFGTGHDKNIANATLMAAAPELLSLLVDIGASLNRGDSIIPSRDMIVLAKIRDLVLKATGGAE